MLDGRFDLLLDGQRATAGAGGLIRLPMGVPHGIFNKTENNVICLFGVAPTRRLWDLFVAIDRVPDPGKVIRLAARHEVTTQAIKYVANGPRYLSKSGRRNAIPRLSSS